MSKKDMPKKKETPEEKKKLNYEGVIQIGDRWYHHSDGHVRGFATADECALHFNGYRK